MSVMILEVVMEHAVSYGLASKYLTEHLVVPYFNPFIVMQHRLVCSLPNVIFSPTHLKPLRCAQSVLKRIRSELHPRPCSTHCQLQCCSCKADDFVLAVVLAKHSSPCTVTVAPVSKHLKHA